MSNVSIIEQKGQLSRGALRRILESGLRTREPLPVQLAISSCIRNEFEKYSEIVVHISNLVIMVMVTVTVICTVGHHDFLFAISQTHVINILSE